MLKWKNISVDKGAAGIETIVDILAGLAGKARRIVKISFVPTNTLYVRIYRDAEQIVDYHTYVLNGEYPVLDIDLPLSEGQQCKGGFYSGSAGAATYVLAVCYEEAE